MTGEDGRETMAGGVDPTDAAVPPARIDDGGTGVVTSNRAGFMTSRPTRLASASARLGLGALGFSLLAGFTVVKDPGENEPVVWANPTVSIVVQQDGSADITDGSDLAAVQQAIAAWSAGCSSFSFTDGGVVASASSAHDGVNAILWMEGGDSALSGAVATTIRRRDTGTTPDTWSDVDVLLNGRDQDGFVWSTGGRLDRYDVGHVVTHELGHVAGLQHAAHPSSTMYFGGSRGHTFGRTLHEDDVAALCFLYPAGAFACATDADCPLLNGSYGGGDVRLRCAAGSCVMGAAGYGADCLAPGHCASGACVDDPRNNNGADPGWCAASCTPSGNDCPGGDYCTTAAGSPLCALGRADCLFDSDCDVDANDVCPLDLDGVYRCRDLCLLDEQCEGDDRCHGGTGSNPPGFCRAPGPAADGTACDDGYDCLSLTCAGSSAAAVCVEDPVGDPEPDPGPSMEPDPGPTMEPDPGPTMEPDPGPTMEPDPGPTMEPDPVDAGTMQPDPEPTMEPDDPSDGGPGGDLGNSCGCSSADPAGAGLFLGLAGLALSRRHRRRRVPR